MLWKLIVTLRNYVYGLPQKEHCSVAKPPRKISKFQDFRNYFGRFRVLDVEKSDF